MRVEPIGGLTLYIGDNREMLREIPDNTVQTVVTSPPYYGLRGYGNDARELMEMVPF